MSILFTPLTLRSLTLRNRIAVAPMLQGAAVDGQPTAWHHVHIGRFAIGGVGLIMMESTKVEPRGRGTIGDLGLWDDAVVPLFRPIVDFAHRHGAAIGIQLGHTGRKRGVTSTVPDEAVAPSAIRHGPDKVMPRALELSEIPGVVDAFAAAARRAVAAGFDTVELHGAHGYLLHAFLSPVANQRTDRYGGSEENRQRLMLEVTEAVRKQVPQDKPLFVRLSCEDQAGVGPEQIVPLVAKLKALGVDVIDCSSGGLRDDMRDIPGVNADVFGYQVPYARQLRAETGVATMAVGHIIHAQQAEAILQDGAADIIALGREMLYNPNWAIDAAQKLGEDPGFDLLPAYVRGPMASRRRRFGGTLSTYVPGWADAEPTEIA